jgi:hypothetical protein
MKKMLITALAASALTAAAVPAAAQSWVPLNQQQRQLDAQIDQGVRNGALTRAEAAQLRTDFRGIAAVEARYRASNGLQANEVADLQMRLNILRARIFINKNDAEYVRSWQPINVRQAVLEQRIRSGINTGQLNAAEATRLRAEFNTIVALEATYRRSGGFLSIAERRDLDQRLTALNTRIMAQRNDRQVAGGGAWVSINQRQANLFARIEQGVRNGALTRAEAERLRAEFNQILGMERAYRASGNVLTVAERADLDRRMNALSARIFVQKHDRQDRR